MGDRSNVFIQQVRSPKGHWHGIGIYAHWAGPDLHAAALDALAQPAIRGRIGDPPYVTRMIVQYVLDKLGARPDGLSFGLWCDQLGLCDNEYDILVINAETGHHWMVPSSGRWADDESGPADEVLAEAAPDREELDAALDVLEDIMAEPTAVRFVRIDVDGSVSILTAADHDGTYQVLRDAVDGYIQMIPLGDAFHPERPPTEQVTAWMNEEGKLRPMPHNPVGTLLCRELNALLDGDWIAGPLVLSGGSDAEGNTLSAPAVVLAWAAAIVKADLDPPLRYSPVLVRDLAVVLR
jgi:hypothetical protein